MLKPTITQEINLLIMYSAVPQDCLFWNVNQSPTEYLFLPNFVFY